MVKLIVFTGRVILMSLLGQSIMKIFIIHKADFVEIKHCCIVGNDQRVFVTLYPIVSDPRPARTISVGKGMRCHKHASTHNLQISI